MMSDGYTDMMRECERMKEDYLEGCVRYFEEMDSAQQARIAEDLKILGDCWLAFLQNPIMELFSEIFGSDFKILDHLIARLKARELLSLESIFILLFLNGENMKLIRLQKITPYVDSLLIFTDEQRRIEPYGVCYATGANFVDGDQDILLGIAKKRTNVVGNNQGRLLIVADWNIYRKRWKVSEIFVV